DDYVSSTDTCGLKRLTIHLSKGRRHERSLNRLETLDLLDQEARTGVLKREGQHLAPCSIDFDSVKHSSAALPSLQTAGYSFDGRSPLAKAPWESSCSGRT